MCECGCGEFQPFARFPGPEGVMYTISAYLSVDCGCGNPAGVVITRLTTKVLKEWGMSRREITRLPKLAFNERLHEFAIAIIGKDELRQVGQEQIIGDTEIELDAQEIGDVLQEALHLTAKRYPPIPLPSSGTQEGA